MVKFFATLAALTVGAAPQLPAREDGERRMIS